MTGPMPVRANSAIPMGRFTRLKNGGPTVIACPVRPSVINGNRVPHMIAKAAPRKIRLLNRKAASRERND